MSTVDLVLLATSVRRATLSTVRVVEMEMPRTTLGQHVSVVVWTGPEEEVVWADAARVVATVQHTEPIRNGTVDQLPRHTMGGPALRGCDRERAIALFDYGALPKPASIRLRDLRPEAFCQCASDVRCSRYVEILPPGHGGPTVHRHDGWTVPG